MQLQTLRDLFVEQLRDLHSAETQLVEALPTMAAAATHDELRQAFEHHLEETRDHVARLDEIFGMLGVSHSGHECKGMKGLIEEGREFVTMQAADTAVRDAGLIAAAQRVEHYEISGYGTAKTLAGHLDLGEAKDLLDRTLDEEANADKLLTKIATGGTFKSGINQEAKAR